MKIFYTDQFVLPLPDGHRFPMSKYARLRERVFASELAASNPLIIPHAATNEELGFAHAADYWGRVQRGELTAKETRRIGFPWSPQMVERSRRSAGATIEACAAALQDGLAVNLAGGTHHAYRDHGEGYCVFNDSPIAARTMQAQGKVKRVAIIACDVHQGNGTASILQGDDSVFTFSIHGAKNFPFHKEQSDLDIALVDKTGDDEYLESLANALPHITDRSQPDLAIYLAGADPYFDDTLGRLALTKDGLLERDRLVLDHCRSKGIPIAITMAGGYAKNVDDTVDIHFQTVQLAVEADNH